MPSVHAVFDDVDEMCATIESWDAEMVPLANVNAHDGAGHIIQAGSLECQYMFAEFAIGYSMRGSPPGGLVTFNIQEPTKRHYWWRGQDLDSDMVWVFPVGGELQSISAPGFRVHTLSVTEQRIAAIADQLDIDLPPAAKRPEAFRLPSRVMQGIRSRFNGMRNTSQPFPFAYADEIPRLLMPHWLGDGASRAGRRPSIPARQRAIRKSLEIIDSSAIQDVSTDLLLQECHVSERTLQYAFSECFATSPAAFIKALRLARARSALINTDPEQRNVGEIAADFGFWHLSQFAADYRKRFGESPSTTLVTTDKGRGS